MMTSGTPGPTLLGVDVLWVATILSGVAAFAARIHARPSFMALLERERAALARPLA